MNLKQAGFIDFAHEKYSIKAALLAVIVKLTILVSVKSKPMMMFLISFSC